MVTTEWRYAGLESPGELRCDPPADAQLLEFQLLQPNRPGNQT